MGRPDARAFLLALLVVLAVAHSATHMVGSGDSWIALAAGRHHVRHGVPAPDPFSFQGRPPGPTAEQMARWPGWARDLAGAVPQSLLRGWLPTGWINQNWLSHVLLYGLATRIGTRSEPDLDALAYGKFFVQALLALVLLLVGRWLALRRELNALATAGALVVGRTFIDIRPAVLTNLCAALLLLIVVASTRRSAWIWALVPLIAVWADLHGGFVYGLLMMVVYLLLHALAPAAGEWVVQLPRGLLPRAVSAWVISGLAAAVLSPYGLTNLVHPSVVSIGSDAALWRSVQEWRPAFDSGNPVGSSGPFLALLLVVAGSAGLWFVVGPMAAARSGVASAPAPGRFSCRRPVRIDFALCGIAAATMSMAVLSRRFIPLAAIVAAPTAAMLLDRALTLLRRRAPTGGAAPPGRIVAPDGRRNRARARRATAWAAEIVTWGRVGRNGTVIGTLVLLLLASVWAGKFSRAYLDPWPWNASATGPGERMMRADMQPRRAARFLRDNLVRGRIFNEWTEGGYLAWSQQPDPTTGALPLRLFIDGRSQAAYEASVFQRWRSILRGGPVAELVAVSGRPPTPGQWRRIVAWVVAQLRGARVAWALMPAGRLGGPFARALDRAPDWKVVFDDGDHRLWADVTTPVGRRVYAGLNSGETRFPDTASRDLTLGQELFESGAQARERATALLLQAVRERPTGAAMRRVLAVVASDPAALAALDAFCRMYLQDLAAHMRSYAARDGFGQRLMVARLVAPRIPSARLRQQRLDDRLRRLLRESSW